jgi:muramidase (phage lysozyme)
MYPITRSRKAFLDAIAFSEIGPELLRISDDGYNVCVGSTPAHPILFFDYSRHPRIRCEALNSDAAGRYQFLGRYWEGYRKLLRLPDFGPASQDQWALHLVRECRALGDVDQGRIESAVLKCRSRWASFPAAGFGQHENTMASLVTAYEAAYATFGEA